MKRALYALVFLMFACACPVLCAAELKPAKLPDNEKLVYRVKWLGVDIGAITSSINGIKNINGRDAYELEITAGTNDFLSAIDALFGMRYFDYAAGKAYFRNLLNKSEKTVPIPEDAQDPVSVAYLFRITGIALCGTRDFSVYNNESIYELSVVADARRCVKIPKIGMREALHIQPCAKLDGENVKKGRASAYFSCDGRMVPLIGSVKAPLFTEITAYLESCE